MMILKHDPGLLLQISLSALAILYLPSQYAELAVWFCSLAWEMNKSQNLAM